MNAILVPNGDNGFETDEEFFIFLKIMAMREFYETFEHVARNQPVSYGEIARHVVRKKIVKKDMLGSTLSALSNMGLIRPPDQKGQKTQFTLTRFGEKIAKSFDSARSTFVVE